MEHIEDRYPWGDVTLTVQISLAIRGLLDQQVVVRAGGVYWVTVDQLADARLLARQFLEAIPELVPATLICCAGDVQSITNEMAADLGPDKLRLFEIPQSKAEQGLAMLTQDMGRAGITANSQVTLVLPASCLAETTTAKHLKLWCQRLHEWLQARNATLLVITHGEAALLHAELVELNETLSGLGRLYRYNGVIRYHLHFWHNDMGVTAGQEFKLAIQGNALTLIPDTAVDLQPRVADDQHLYLAERAVLEGTPSLSKYWYLFESLGSLLNEARTARQATVIVGIDNSHQLFDLAQNLYDLREQCGPALKIVVREMEPAVRYRDERLLLACGANLIVPDGTLLSRFLSMIESVQGQRWQYSQNSDFATLLERQRPPDIRGLVSPRKFFEAIEQIYNDSSGDVTHQLVRFRVDSALDDELFLNQMCLRRYGDFACLLGDDLYLFLFACRADGLDPALGNICRLPWSDLFILRQVLAGIDDLPREAFLQAESIPAHLNIPFENSVIATPAAVSRMPLTAQRTILPLRELQP